MSSPINNIRVRPNLADLAAAAAEELFSLALPARAAGFWNLVHFFWVDERDVPHDHPDSNYRQAKEILLSRIDITAE